MCFGGKGGGGGHQGGGSSQEDAEIRRSHSEAGISAAETRRHFRERDNPAHSRNENAAGATKSVSHSRDEGGNLVAKRVEYGQGSFAPPQGEREGRMKAENILGKRDDVFQVGSDLSVGGTIFENAKLSKSGNSIISTDPNNVGTIGGITGGGGLWGGNKIKSVLGVTDGVGAVNSRGIGTSLITPVLDEQRRSRTAKYQAQSDLFKNSTPAEIEAIRAANRKKNPADQDGDGSWLTSTDDMGRVAGIGSRGDGSGAQPYIFDPTLGKEYQALPQLDPNRGADTNLTMFGKGMRTVGKPVAGALIPGAGALMLLDRFSDKVPSFLTGGDAPGSANDQALLRQEDDRTMTPTPTTRFATSDQNSPNPFSETSSTSTEGSALSGFRSPYPQKRPTVNVGSPVFDRSVERLKNIGIANVGSPVFDRSETRLKDMGTSDIGALSSPVFRPQLRPDMSGINTSTLTQANNRGETIMVDGFPKSYAKEVPISTYFRMNDPLGNDNNDNFDQVMPPVGEGEEQSIYDRFNYRKWLASNPTLIGQSSYGGKFGSGQPNYMASVSPAGIYSSGDPSAQVLTDFYNPTTGQYYTAPNAGYYAEEGSDWRRGRPTEAYNLPIVA